jgi:two-component sensor histidine kinase
MSERQRLSWWDVEIGMADSGEASSSRLRQQAAAIAEFGILALRTHDLDGLLQRAAALVSEGLNISLAKVLELLPDGDRLLVRAGVGWGPDVVGKATIGADERSPAGYALQTGQPVVSEDLSQELRFDMPPLLQEHGIKSAINVIIRGEGAPFGVLEVDSRQIRHFTQDDINFLQSCANLIAAALDRLTAETKLQSVIEEKQVLLYELQHRVKNSLQEITSLVDLQRRKLSNPDARRPLEMLGSRLGALSVVYRKLYLADHHMEVDLGAYLAELLAELSAFHGIDPQAITTVVRVPEMHLDLEHALPLGLVACEFIVNSFKYAFPEGRGQISAQLEPIEGGRARLTLADNGIGLPAQGNQAPGMGLHLIRRLVEQIEGEIEMANEGGARMTITFTVVRRPQEQRG